MNNNAVITRVIPYGDADLVVRLFTADHGRVAAFARKARASRKRFAGLSAPSLGRAVLKERRAADLLDLVELDVDPAVLGLAHDLRGLAHAAYIAELVERMLPEHEGAPEVFAIVDEAVGLIARGGPSAILLRALELKLLLHLGYLPDLHDPKATSLDAIARGTALALVSAPLAALPPVDDAPMRAVSRLFHGHLRAHGGPPLQSVRFLDAVAAVDRSR